MKPTTETVAPPSAPELFTHEWDVSGVCINPERFALDGMPKDSEAEFRLGMGPDNQWRVMWFLGRGSTAMGKDYVTLDDNPRESRALALQFGLTAAEDFFKKDKRALKVLAGVRAKLDADQGKASSPANKADDGPVPVPTPAEVSVDAIEDNPRNERERTKEYIAELAESITKEGLMQRIAVRLLEPSGDSLPGVPPAPRYMLVYGGCRLAAVRLLKHATIRAEVYPLELTPRQESRLIKAENLKRKNPNPVEEAQGFADHMREFNLTQDEMAKEVGKSRPVIANALRLLDLPDEVRALLGSGPLTPAHGTALCRFKDFPLACEKIAELAVKKGTPAGALEKDLPFHEDLIRAKVAIDIFEEGNVYDYEETNALEKKLKGKPGFFEVDDEYSDATIVAIDLEAGRAVLKELAEERKKEEAAQAARSKKSAAERSDDDSGSSGGGMTPAQKREANKKKDDNLKRRLGNDAMHYAGLERLKKVKEVDLGCVTIVVREAFKHAMGGYGGWDSLADLAKDLGIAWPKRFAEDDLDALATLAPADLLRLGAAAIGEREYLGAMRNAWGLQDDLAALAACKESEAAAAVEEWKKRISPLVVSGMTAEEIQKEIGCPEFLAVNLRRQIKRELNESKAVETEIKSVRAKTDALQHIGKPSPKLAADIAALAAAKKKLAAVKAPKVPKAKKNGARAIITDETRAAVKRLVEAGKTGAEIAKACGISLPSVQNIKKALGLVMRR